MISISCCGLCFSSILLLLFLTWDTCDAYQIGYQPIYLAVTPKKIRLGTIATVSVTVFRTDVYGLITIRASAIRDLKYEVAFAQDTWTKPGTRILQIVMPQFASDGFYTMRVSGWAGPFGVGFLFQNETTVMFDRKMLSVFIQLSKTVYHQDQVIRGRVVPTRRNLLPYSDRFNIYLVDPNGVLARRWFYTQPNAGGVMDIEYVLPDQASYGNWSVRVDYKQFSYYKKFRVIEYFQPRFDVNLTTPYMISDASFGILGIVGGNHTSGRPTHGNVSIEMRLVDQATNTTYATLKRFIPYLEGMGTFFFTMAELKQVTGKQYMQMTELFFTAFLCDWFLDMCLTGRSYTYIYGSKPQLKWLGGRTRTFKPGFPTKAYLVVYDQSGLPLVRPNQQVEITVMCGENSLQQQCDHMFRTVPDSGIVEYILNTDPQGRIDRYELNAKYIDVTTNLVIPDFVPPRQLFTQTWSPSLTYMQVSTTTPTPHLDQYMIFRVQTNRYQPLIYYQVISGGNIVYAGELEMINGATSKTFSVAVSRDWVPVARMLAFYVRTDGEVVADSLTFFVNSSRSSMMQVTVNRAKDLRMETIEVNGYALPASYITFSAVNYDFYLMGGDNGPNEYEILDEQLSWDNYAQQPFLHEWNYNRDFRRRIYVNAPSFGMDANTTWEWAGMRIFSDTNRTSFYQFCNVSDPSRPFSCYSQRGDMLCYDVNKTCNGILDCYTGVDEMDCPPWTVGGQLNVQPAPRAPLDVFNLISRHYIDGEWFWRSYYVKPEVYGSRIDFRVTLPHIAADWVINSFAVHPDEGLMLVTEPPPRFSGTRRFFIFLEYPEEVRRGELIGIRAAVYNYWTYWTEALVWLEASPNYKFISVQWRGATSSYSPTLQSGEIHNLVYLPAGESRYVHMPIVPTTYPGNVTFRVCAYSFIGADCITGNVAITMDGFTNTYHTPLLLDLNRATNLQPTYMWIVINDVFVNPETREHYYVWGSQTGNISIVGDVLGPALSPAYPFGATNNVLYWNRPYYSTEAALFNLGYNMHLLKYLRFTNQLTNQTMIPALFYCIRAIERVLSQYNYTDGSFSQFRDYYEPSVWVTASVLLQMAEAAELRDFENWIFIDSNLLANMTLWLVRQQVVNYTDIAGAFNETAPYIYDPKFISKWTVTCGYCGPGGTQMTLPANISLTAYVIISLRRALELNLLSGRAQTSASQAITLARGYLEARSREISSTWDAFELTIMTYALQISGSTADSYAFSKLQQRTFGSDQIYIANEMLPANPTHTDNTRQYVDPRIELYNEGYAVHATSYLMLIFSKQNPANLTAIVRWLNTMRNTQYGFASSSDTLAAIRALRQYAENNVNRRLWQMHIDVTPNAISRTYGIDIYNNTFSQVQYVPIEKVYSGVTMQALGTGWALLQMTIKANVEFPYQVKKGSTQGFQLVVTTFQPTMRNYSVLWYKLCSTWLLSQYRKRSAMAVIEIDIPSGYIVTNDVLRNYARSGVVPNLRHAYRKNKMVTFHFNYIDSVAPTCVDLRIDRWYPVANVSIQYGVRAYEYYEPGTYNQTAILDYTVFGLNICHVCGSFQCPYCPDYNAAPTSLQPTPARIALTALLVSASFLLSPFSPFSLFTP